MHLSTITHYTWNNSLSANHTSAVTSVHQNMRVSDDVYEIDDAENTDHINLYIYFSGYIISLAALLLALLLLKCLKNLKCSRNSIHCNMIISFVLSIASWFFFYYVISLYTKKLIHLEQIGTIPESRNSTQSGYRNSTKSNVDPKTVSLPWKLCTITWFIYYYLHTCSYFWMLNEGLFLFQLLIRGFENKVSPLKFFKIIGWGVPWIMVTITILYRYVTLGDRCSQDKTLNYLGYSWFIIIIINFSLLLVVCYIVYKKRKSPVGHPKDHSYKGFLFLMPLFGITHLFFSNGHYFSRRLSPALHSTQGLAISLYCCYLNGEVHQALISLYKIWANAKNRRSSSNNSATNPPSALLFPPLCSVLTNTITHSESTMEILDSSASAKGNGVDLVGKRGKEIAQWAGRIFRRNGNDYSAIRTSCSSNITVIPTAK
ncbi:unnamed protein product [Gordionus sp. m RMFG-2023]|uniref:corticotropin-releasing factor receptor 1-like n=1 Tax=Gordionus sp. m RMFG-2023 TaxID=3053472 RepID=UPI0030E57C3A